MFDSNNDTLKITGSYSDAAGGGAEYGIGADDHHVLKGFQIVRVAAGDDVCIGHRGFVAPPELRAARGASRDEMATALFISPHTVQDHLKAIFAKTATRSRRALLSRALGS